MIRGGDTVNDNEVVEPLDDDGHVIIQPKDGYRFGADAIALYKFALRFVGRGSRVFEPCSGCGVIGISLAVAADCEVVGAEIDKELCDMSNRSAVLDGLERAMFFNADVRTFEPSGKFDCVVCNPPFFKADGKPRKTAPAATGELTVTFADIAEKARRVLKHGGAFLTVHTASRLDEVLCVCREKRLMPKTLAIINNGKAFLLKAVLGGKAGLTVEIGK